MLRLSDLRKERGVLRRTQAGSDTRRNLSGQIMGKHEYRLSVWEIEERYGVRVKFLFHPIAYPGGTPSQHSGLTGPCTHFSSHIQVSTKPPQQTSTDMQGSPSSGSRRPHGPAAIFHYSSLPSWAFGRTYFQVSSCMPSPQEQGIAPLTPTRLAGTCR